jgi:hypothetical protein
VLVAVSWLRFAMDLCMLTMNFYLIAD